MLGSTGSIGTQTLEIASEQPDKFKAVALSAGRNINLLTEQVKTHKPEVVAIEDENLIEDLKDNINNLDLDDAPLVLGGKQGINAVAAWDKADTVVTGIVGCAGLIPTMSAINAGKNIALANKETLIAAGPIVIPALKKNNSRLLPADSEHSAIFQCLQGLPNYDSKGRTVDFKNTLLIMTSNIGSKVIEKGGGGLGFEFSGDSIEDSQYNRIKSLVNEELKQYFRPEFLNRLDEIIVFRQLTKNEVKEIAVIMLQEVFARLQDKGIKLNVTDAFKERLVEEGYNPSYGARPLRRAVMRLLEDSLAEEVLSGRIKDGDNALVDIDDNKKVTINISSEESSQELAGANF